MVEVFFKNKNEEEFSNMSLCFILQTKNEIYIAADSRVSAEINGKKYRWHDNYSKIVQIDNYVIFKGGSAGVLDKIIDRFKDIDKKDLITLQQLSINEYERFVKNEGKNFKPYKNTNKMTVSIIVSTIENNNPVAYFISDANNFDILRIKLPNNKNMQDITLGVKSDEARDIYMSCTFDFESFDNVFNNYRKIYEGVTGVEIGGTLTVYRVSKNEIINKSCGLMNQKYVNELSEYLLNKYCHKMENLYYRFLANCTSLKIHDVNILDELNTIKGDFLSENSVGIGKLKLNELYVGAGGIRLDSSATISWGQVSNQPFIPSTASHVGALSTLWANGLNSLPTYITSTKITSTTIESPSIIGGSITSNTSINVGTNVYIGSKLFMNPDSFSSDIVFTSGGVKIYGDPGGNSLTLSAPGGVWAGSQRLDVPVVAKFG